MSAPLLLHPADPAALPSPALAALRRQCNTVDVLRGLEWHLAQVALGMAARAEGSTVRDLDLSDPLARLALETTDAELDRMEWQLEQAREQIKELRRTLPSYPQPKAPALALVA